MDIYLPIAELSVNALVIILMGGAVGFLSGMFGVGGGVRTPPLLIVPPFVLPLASTLHVTAVFVEPVTVAEN